MVEVRILVTLWVLVVVQTGTGTLVPSRPGQTWQGLEVVGELLGHDGPLIGQRLVVYVPQDPSLVQALLTLPTLRATPLVLVQMRPEPQGIQWTQEQPAAILSGAHLVHVAVFVEDPRPFFRTVVEDTRWNPKFLILVNLDPGSARHVLSDQVFYNIQHCVLLEAGRGRRDGAVEVLAHFPFLLSHQVQSLGLLGIGTGDNGTAFGDTRRTWVGQTQSRQEMTGSGWTTKLFVDRFPSFEGYKFLLGTWFTDFPYLYQSLSGPEGEGDGVMVEMLNAMSPVFNFTYHLTTQSPDYQWGDLVKGSWTGMLGMISSGGKNFTINMFSYTIERNRDFDPSVSFWMEGFGLALMAPPPLPKWRSIYYPFVSLVWASVAAVFVFAVTAMMLQSQMTIGDMSVTGGVGGVWAYLLRPMLNHSLPTLPTAQWQRVFMATWVLSCFILTTAYTANLIAFLTIPAFPERIQTVEQLAASNYRVVMHDYGDFLPIKLKTSQAPFYRALGDKLDLYPEIEDTIIALKSGTHSLTDTYSFTHILLNVEHKVPAYMLRQQLYPSHLCWYFQKNTAWKYKFDGGIQRLVEAGFIPHWLKIKREDFLGLNYFMKESLADKEHHPPTALTLGHLQGVFLLLGPGLVGSLGVLLVERLSSASRRSEI